MSQARSVCRMGRATGPVGLLGGPRLRHHDLRYPADRRPEEPPGLSPGPVLWRDHNPRVRCDAIRQARSIRDLGIGGLRVPVRGRGRLASLRWREGRRARLRRSRESPDPGTTLVVVASCRRRAGSTPPLAGRARRFPEARRGRAIGLVATRHGRTAGVLLPSCGTAPAYYMARHLLPVRLGTHRPGRRPTRNPERNGWTSVSVMRSGGRSVHRRKQQMSD